MIGKDEIAESVRYSDAEIEEHSNFPGYWAKRGVDYEGLRYVAEQRGLRVVMIERGQSPNITKPTPVALSSVERHRLMMYAASFMDGFAVGFNVTKEKE